MGKLSRFRQRPQNTAQAVENLLARQQRSVSAAVGAWTSYAEAMQAQRWRREMSDDLLSLGMLVEQADAIVGSICSEIETEIAAIYDRYGPREERLGALEALYAGIRSRLNGQAESVLAVGVGGEQMLYKLYDAVGHLLYVGITDRGPARLVEHYRHKEWFPLVNRVEFERYPTRDAVLKREEEAIKTLRPLFNIVHNQARREQNPRVVG